MNKAMSNKMWRKTHLFEGEYIGKLDKSRSKDDYVKVVDKNNHKVELVIINGKAYRK